MPILVTCTLVFGHDYPRASSKEFCLRGQVDGHTPSGAAERWARLHYQTSILSRETFHDGVDAARNRAGHNQAIGVSRRLSLWVVTRV